MATRVDAKPISDPSALRLRLHQPTGWNPRSVAFERLVLTIEQKMVVVFAVWIRIGADFHGTAIVPSIDLPSFHTHPADLERRGRWQKIWTTAHLSAGRHERVLSVNAIAPARSVLNVGGWSVDVGPAPRARTWPFGIGTIKRRARGVTRRGASGVSSIENSGGEVLRRSALAMARGSYIEAEDLIATALAEAPCDAMLLKQYAFCAHNRGNYNRAVDRWSEALLAAPDDAMCHAGVAANYREGGNWPAAVPVIEKALGLFPNDGTVLTEAARIAVAQSRYGDAVSLLDRAITLYGAIPELTTSRDQALARHEQGLPREALS